MTPAGGSTVSMGYTGQSQAERLSEGQTGYQYDVTGLSMDTNRVVNTMATMVMQRSLAHVGKKTKTKRIREHAIYTGDGMAGEPDGTVDSVTVNPTGTSPITEYPVTNVSGSVVQVVDQLGNVTQQTSYAPDGSTTSNTLASGAVPYPYSSNGDLGTAITNILMTAGGAYYDTSTMTTTQPSAGASGAQTFARQMANTGEEGGGGEVANGAEAPGGEGEGRGGNAGDAGTGGPGAGVTFRNTGPKGLPVGGPIKSYSYDAEDRAFDGRGDGGVSNYAIEYTIRHGEVRPGNRPNTVVYHSSLADVVLNPKTGNVVTVIPRSSAGRRDSS